MRFLITGKNNFPIPPEMGSALVDATIAWAKKYTSNGKFEQTWGLAGIAGGGAIANVDSSDELDAIMVEFPFGPFTNTEIYALTDMVGSLERLKQVIQAMTLPGK